MLGPGGRIAFSSDRGGDERWSIYDFDGHSVYRVAGEDGSINLLGPWSRDGVLAYTSTSRNGVDFDLYIYKPGRGSRLVARLEGINQAWEWLDDERLLVVASNTNLDSDILLVDTTRGEVRNLTKHTGEAINASPTMIKRDMFAFATSIDSEFTRLAIYDLNGGGWRVVADHGWDVEDLDYMDGTLYYTVNVDGESVIHIWRPGEDSRVYWRPPGTVLHLDASDGIVVASISSPAMGNEVFIVRNMYGERVTYSPKAGVVEEDLAYPSRFSYKSIDGLEVHGLLYTPRTGEPPMPAIVWLHGGPESQERIRFNLFHQLFTSLGLAVVAPNFRGSLGYGKTFVHLDDLDKRINAVHDVYYAVEHLASKGILDWDRVCVMGGSYGGYLTLMSLALYPEAWRCGVDIVGIVNLVTFIRNTSPYRRRYRIMEYGDPDKHGELMLKLSPITYIDKIKAPLMVVHGANDPRVPVSEAEQLVNALNQRGVKVEYLRLEDEGHGISKIENRIKVYTRVASFILKHLNGQSSSQPSPS